MKLPLMDGVRERSPAMLGEGLLEPFFPGEFMTRPSLGGVGDGLRVEN